MDEAFVVDYTKKRLNSKNGAGYIRKCPKCGKKALALHFKGGKSKYIHKTFIHKKIGPIDEFCSVMQHR